jgi:hypothetical protein
MNTETADIQATASPDDSRNASARIVFWGAACFITVVAGWVHFNFLMHAGGLWRDEVNLVNLAQLPSVGEMRQDSFPIMFPLLVRLWMILGLGQSDVGLRWFGFLMGLGLLAAFWVAAWLTSRKPPLLALALMGLNALALTYGDSLRAYGLGSGLAVLFLAAMWAYLAKPSCGRCVCAGAFAIVSVQTLFHNAVLVAAICLAGGAVCLRRKDYWLAGRVLLIGLAAGVTLLPYLGIFVSGLEPSAVWRTGFRPGFVWLDLTTAIGFPTPFYVWIWILMVSLCVVNGGIRQPGFWLQPSGPGRKTAEDLSLFLAVTVVLALAGFGLFLWLTAVATQPWYFLPVMALVAACLDSAMQPMHRYFSAALLAFALGTTLLAFPMARINTMSRLTNVDLLARRLTKEAKPEDYVVVAPWFCGISFARYFKGPSAWATVPPLDDHRFHRFDVVNQKLRQKNIIRPVLEKMAETLRAGHQVWLLGMIDVPASGTLPPQELPPPPLPGWGWSQTPYLQNWERQVTSFLSQHAREFALVEVTPAGDVNPNENLKLAKADGWRP